jgi:hypothetical protein
MLAIIEEDKDEEESIVVVDLPNQQAEEKD